MNPVRHVDKVGVAGSIVASLCCLGVSAVVSVLSAVGLGFIINDAVLAPLLLVFLAITLAGLTLGFRRHHRPWALWLGAIAGPALFIFSFVAPSRPLAFASIAGLIAASVLNVLSPRFARAP